MLQIIDCEKKGNLVRFYLGDATKNYRGDSWDKKPYELNASEVYDEFIEGFKDMVFPFDSLVLEPSDSDNHGSHYSRNDFKERRLPCVIVIPKEVIDDWHDTYEYYVGNDDERIQRFYFGDNVSIQGSHSRKSAIKEEYSPTLMLNKLKSEVDFSELDGYKKDYVKALNYAIKCVGIVDKAKKI